MYLKAATYPVNLGIFGMWVLIIFFGAHALLALIFWRSTNKFFWISLFGALAAYFALIVFYNPTHKQFILDASSDHLSYNVNWPSSFTNNGFETVVVKDIAFLSKFMNTTSGGVRPAGAMHSTSPLMSTKGSRYVLDLQQLSGILGYNGTHIKARAGTKIGDVLKYLAVYRKTLRGVGVYTGEQTIAGGFSTSLSGIELQSFSQFATWAKTVDGIGSIVEWDDLYYLRDSMGMLGVIVELEFEVFDYYDLEATIHEEATMDDLISYAFDGDVFAFDSITTLYADHTKIKSVSYQRLGGRNATATSVKGDNDGRVDEYVLNLIDYFLIPISFVLPLHLALPLVQPFILNDNGPKTSISRDTHVAGLAFLEYRVPASSCKAFLHDIVMQPQDGLVKVKFLRTRNDTCLAYRENTCKLELYIPAHNVINTYETIAWKHGGYSHWGKYLGGNVTKQFETFPCWAQFKDLQNVHDPHGRFMNEYLTGVEYPYWNEMTRLWAFYGIFAVVLVMHPVWFMYLLIYFLITCKRDKKGETGDTKRDANSETTALLVDDNVDETPADENDTSEPDGESADSPDKATAAVDAAAEQQKVFAQMMLLQQQQQQQAQYAQMYEQMQQQSYQQQYQQQAYQQQQQAYQQQPPKNRF